ncbi:MAG: TRAP transporter substrate-binding protein [Bacteroidota bacterium]
MKKILPLLILLLLSCQEQEKSQSKIDFDKTFHWRMVTTWPPNFPVLGEAAQYLADDIKNMSGGRIQVKVYGGGELVPPLEAFDAVSQGTADIGSGVSYYWAGKSAAAQFFAAVPFGMNTQQMNSWMTVGGGYELWCEVYEPFNLVPFMGGNTGMQMGGWFNREINSLDDLKGLKMRIPGLGGKVLEKAGGAAVLVPGSEVYTSLETGVIDAAEWIGPYHDYRMGFYKITDYYYTPGWHEPSAQLEFFANKSALESLPPDLQEIVKTATHKAQTWVLSEFDKQNALTMEKLKIEHQVEVRSFPQPVLDQLKIYTDEAIQETIGDDPLANKVYKAYKAYQESSGKWLENTEELYFERIK